MWGGRGGGSLHCPPPAGLCLSAGPDPTPPPQNTGSSKNRPGRGWGGSLPSRLHFELPLTGRRGVTMPTAPAPLTPPTPPAPARPQLLGLLLHPSDIQTNRPEEEEEGDEEGEGYGTGRRCTLCSVSRSVGDFGQYFVSGTRAGAVHCALC